jgi:hypothetical protein
MDSSARIWLAKTARANLWRIYHWYDLDELIADGVLCWQIVVAKYPDVNKRSQQMALFKTTFTNHMHRLANSRSKQAIDISTDKLPEQENEEEDLRGFTTSAPAAVRALLLAIIDHPELLKYPPRRWLGGRRETTNQWLCRLIGLDDTQFDLHSQLLNFLGPLKEADTDIA